jgi:hypothetical protein
MDLSRLQSLYEQGGPYATVYLEARSPAEDAAAQSRLRWQGLRDELSAAGAGDGVCDALESAVVDETAGRLVADGRVLVATSSGVAMDEPWDAALGAGDVAHWGELPELGAYVREYARAVRMLVLIVDQNEASVQQVVVSEQHEPREAGDEEVRGGAVAGVHKPREGALSHKRIQRKADEAVKRNADDIVVHVRAVASEFRPRVLVLAGEVQARTAVRDRLPGKLSAIVAETDRGGGPGADGAEALTEELLRIASEHSAAAADDTAERLNTNLAHDLAVQDAEAVAEASRRGAVDTLLFAHGHPAQREAELLKASARGGSGFDLVPAEQRPPGGVAALLRFPITDRG